MFYLQQTSTCNISLSRVLRTVNLVIFTHSVQLDVMMHAAALLTLSLKLAKTGLTKVMAF